MATDEQLVRGAALRMTRCALAVLRTAFAVAVCDCWGLLTVSPFLWAASDHRAGASVPGSLSLQRQRLQLLCLRGGEAGVCVQVSVCLFAAVTFDPRVLLQPFHQVSDSSLLYVCSVEPNWKDSLVFTRLLRKDDRRSLFTC